MHAYELIDAGAVEPQHILAGAVREGHLICLSNTVHYLVRGETWQQAAQNDLSARPWVVVYGVNEDCDDSDLTRSEVGGNPCPGWSTDDGRFVLLRVSAATPDDPYEDRLVLVESVQPIKIMRSVLS